MIAVFWYMTQSSGKVPTFRGTSFLHFQSVVRNVMPRILVEKCQRFEGTCCLNLQGILQYGCKPQFPGNVGIFLPEYTELHPRRQ
jgi:hypothetical protein